MNHRWLIYLSNFSGITYIKVTQNEFQISSILKRYSELKILSMVTLGIIFFTFPEFKHKFYKEDVIMLKYLSDFSRNILFIATQSFHISGLFISILQYSRKKKILKFLEELFNNPMGEKYKIKQRKIFVINTVLNVGFFMISSILRTLRVIKHEYLAAYPIGFITLQSHFVVLSLINLICNIQQTIVLAYHEIRDNLEHFKFSARKSQNVCENLQKLKKIEYFLKTFEDLFGLQLTIIATNFTFSSVLMVN